MHRYSLCLLLLWGAQFGCDTDGGTGPEHDAGSPPAPDAAMDAGAADAGLDARAPDDAGGPPAPLDQVARAGSRLQAVWEEPVDGEPGFLGFFDGERGLRCTFRPAADGKLRCLPDPVGASVYYEDEACEEPRLWWSNGPGCESAGADAGMPDAPPPPFVTVYAALACPLRYTVRSVGDYLDDGVGKEQRRPSASGLCSGSTSDASYMERYELGAEDDLASWVAGEEEVVRGDASRLEVRFIRGADGSYVRVGQYDRELTSPCSAAPMGEDGVRCVPDTASFVSDAYAPDAQCQDNVAATETRCDEGGAFVLGSSEDAGGCPLRTFSARGELLDEVYGGLACMPVDLTASTALLYRLGEPVAGSEFVALEPERPATPRLVRERWKDEHGQTVEPTTTLRWYDNQLAAPCTKQQAADGKARCLPGRYAEVLYADATCGEPVVRAEECDASTHVFTLDQATLTTCMPGQRVYAIGAAVTPGSLFYRIGDDCNPAGAPPEGATYRRLSEVPLAEFVAFE